MSGGYFDYAQYKFIQVADEVEELIKNNNDDTKDDCGYTIGSFYSNETIDEFKKALNCLRLAHVYTQRIDWLVSCDDSEESFHKRLREDLRNLKAFGYPQQNQTAKEER